MKNFIKRLIAGKELNELNRWKVYWQEYRQWLANYPTIAMTLDNLRNEIDGQKNKNCSHPPTRKGPWDISGLRKHLTRIYAREEIATLDDFTQDWTCMEIKQVDKTTEEQKDARIAELEKQLKDASDLVIEQQRTINTLRTVCGEAYELAGSYEKVHLQALDNLYAASIGQPLPHPTFLPIE